MCTVHVCDEKIIVQCVQSLMLDSFSAAFTAVLCLRDWELEATFVAELGLGHAVLVQLMDALQWFSSSSGAQSIIMVIHYRNVFYPSFSSWWQLRSSC